MDSKAQLGGAPPSYQQNAGASMQPSFQTAFASLSLHENDKIRMLAFPPQAQQAVRQIITESWPGGMQREREYYGSTEFKLRGNPWMATGGDAVLSRQLMSHILASLFAQGWVLNLSTDVSKTISDIDTILFRHQSPAPASAEWMAISFSDSDDIRFMWNPVQPNKDPVVDAYIAALGTAVQRHQPRKQAGCYEVKMRGNPWRASGGETMHARSLLLRLLTILEQHGWTVYASIDQKRQRSGNDSSTGDTDTWHCCRAVGWQPGMPVFHN